MNTGDHAQPEKKESIMKTSILPALLIVLCGMHVPAFAVEPINKQNLRDKARQQEPCCSVVAVDAKTGIVSARDKTTGKTFKFNVSDKAMLKGLKAGDAVQANFAAGQVAIEKYSAVPCCNIVP
jgi:Cu/Ag efflux protein CusF